MPKFVSILPSGHVFHGFPFGNHSNGIKLMNPDDVIVTLPQIFLLFTNNNQEDGMISVKKPAGFTIVAKNSKLGVTMQDFVEQVPRIVKLMVDNPEIFNMRTWSNYDNLVIDEVWATSTGYFETFIYTYNIEKLNMNKLQTLEEFESKQSMFIAKYEMSDEDE
jgi:hypothetical protein